ncbi:glycoside hydrolase family 2 protein [Abyssalbus ytuae]|uniref:Glycoside hydrolase family 2 n=1 Tax=Abyssalbus ytuae TaxID=2926907 RepID=A0A9E6ZQW9_9FLAO|nr:glycoside hydrolase family 2 TIM barrel-domain containing protein [Abyssalbus ytuae]UOB17148.1 glycoside hydrolase family 2 [Abyssalbus ytuae]
MSRNIFILISCLFYLRLFSQKTVLEDWEFSLDNEPAAFCNVKIPHTWNKNDAFDDAGGYYRGIGTYKKKIIIKDISKKYYLHFKGSNQFTTLWINNRKVGEHRGGYTSFSFDISDFIQKNENEITITVNNSHNEKIPPLDADFTFYGGIYRSVYLVEENFIHFKKHLGNDYVKTDAVVTKEKKGRVTIHAVITNSENTQKGGLHLSLISPEGTVKTINKKIKLQEGENKFIIDYEIESPLLWSVQTPNLYKLTAEILDKKGLVQDSYSCNIGFRTIQATTKGFFLNGDYLKLTGVNRHQDLEGYGNAVPVHLQLDDLVKIKEMGSNFLRLAHYPQDEEIYKAADSLGLILWSEIPVVNKVPLGNDYESYKENALLMQKEHIFQNYNHPSFVFVGYMNEIFLRTVFDSPAEETKQQIVNNTLDLAGALEDLTRKEAPGHITVMALHGNQIYNETGIAQIPMVIGWNLYFGWYGGNIYDLGGFLDKENKKFPNRPLIISEYGVGADVRLHNENPEIFDFSEEYQLDYHIGYWNQVHERDFVIGMSAWNFADFGSEFRGDAMPHINQKGLVNFNRIPKNIYYWYKATMKPTEKLTRIYRDLPVHLSNSPKKLLKIISNQPVIVKLNGNSIANESPLNNLINLEINLVKGQNVIEVYGRNDILLDKEIIEWKKPLITNKGDLLAINLGSKNYFKDTENVIWYPVTTSTGNIYLAGNIKQVKTSANVKGTSNDPVYQYGLSGLNEIKIEVPKGKYEVKLLYANLLKRKAIAYELKTEKEPGEIISKPIKFYVNNLLVEIDTKEKLTKFEKTIITEVKNDQLQISSATSAPFTLSGIMIKKIEL